MAAKTYRNFNNGLTLIEVMISILLLMVVVIGTAGYRYYSALDARKAEKEEIAARIASLLNEGWRGFDPNSTFDPSKYVPTEIVGEDFVIDGPSAGPTDYGDFILLGSYKATVSLDNTKYTCFITMSYKDLATDGNLASHRRTALSTIVAWPVTTQETNYSNDHSYWEFKLTTYVERGME